MEVGRILMESLLHTGRMTWAMINPTIKAAQSIFLGTGRKKRKGMCGSRWSNYD